MEFSVVVSQTSIRGKTSGVVAKSVLTLTNICMKLFSIHGVKVWKKEDFLFFSLFFLQGYIQEFSSADDLPVELKNKEKEVFSNLEDIYDWHSR